MHYKSLQFQGKFFEENPSFSGKLNSFGGTFK